MEFEGKTVTVRTHGDGKILCAIDQPTSVTAESEVEITRRIQNKKRQMAFHYRFGNKYYCTKVVGEDLKVEEANSCDRSPINMSRDHWFVMEKDGNGKNYNLHPLIDPGRFLVVKKSRPYEVTLN